MEATRLAARRLARKGHRIELARSRFDTRSWVVTRRARTRHLIELGGLVLKADLAALTGDDRAMLYGAFLNLAARLRGEDGEAVRERWKRRGARALAEEAIAPDRLRS